MHGSIKHVAPRTTTLRLVRCSPINFACMDITFCVGIRWVVISHCLLAINPLILSAIQVSCPYRVALRACVYFRLYWITFVTLQSKIGTNCADLAILTASYNLESLKRCVKISYNYKTGRLFFTQAVVKSQLSALIWKICKNMLPEKTECFFCMNRIIK